MGGSGGGGIVMAISICFFSFDPKNAIALSNFSICFSALLRYFLMMKEPHPLKKDRGILIDMNLSVIMLPMITCGASIGVIANTLMSDLVVCIVNVVLNLGMFYLLVKKFREVRGIENIKF